MAIRYSAKAIMMMACIFLTTSSMYGQNFQERRRKDDVQHPDRVITERQSAVFDRDLLDVYVRMMRYQTAWQDIINRTYGDETTPDDYLTIAVRNVNVGNLKNLSNYLKTIKQPSGAILTVNRQTRCAGTVGDECELAYEVKWANERVSGSKFNLPNIGNVDHYITYDITVEYRGMSITHGGMILHYNTKDAGFLIYDGIISQIEELVSDRLPLMVESRRKIRAFSGTPRREVVKELPAAKVWSTTPAEEGVIGWLPSDELELEFEYPEEIPIIMRAGINSINFTVVNANPWHTNWWGGVKAASLNVSIIAVENCDINKWEPEISEVSLTIDYFARLLPGVTEASVQNMNQVNYCQMITDLSAPVNPEANVSRNYYALNAITVHEDMHVSQLKDVFNNRLSILSSDLKASLSIPLSSAPNAAAAVGIMKNNAAFGSTVQSWVNSANATWVATGEVAAQAAEIGVLNYRINELRNTAQGPPPKSWYPSGVMCH